MRARLARRLETHVPAGSSDVHRSAPRRERVSRPGARARSRARENRRLSPETTFGEDMQLFSARRTTAGASRRRPRSCRRSTSTRRSRSTRTASPTPATSRFVFVGNVELERLKALAETYLGSLPSKGRKETWRDVKVIWPKGVQTKTVIKGSEPKSLVTLTFHGSEQWSRDTENDMRMLGEVLRHPPARGAARGHGRRLRRTRCGGISRRPRQEYTFTVSFGCAPDNVEKLKQAVFDEIKAIAGQRHRRRLPDEGERSSAPRPRDRAQGERLLGAASSTAPTRSATIRG